MNINLGFTGEMRKISEELDANWSKIPADKVPLYSSVFWIIWHAKELLATHSEHPSETISLRHFRGRDLKARINGFAEEFKLDWQSALSEIDRVSRKLGTLGWVKLDMPIASYLDKCDEYTSTYLELKRQLKQEAQ